MENQQQQQRLDDGDQADQEEATLHKLEALKMTEIRAKSGNDSDESGQNEWTVVYSDSNSSILSGGDDDDEEENIDISVVDEAIIEKDDQLEGELDGEDQDAPNLKKLDEITLNNDDGIESKFQIWEQSVDSTSGGWVKPILVSSTAIDDTTDTPPSPSPSYGDNEYESSDIDIINDDEEFGDDDRLLNDDRDSILSMSINSVISQTSNLSALQEQYYRDYLSKKKGFAYKFFPAKYVGSSVAASEDDPSSNQPFDPVPLTKGERIRAYVHTPNTVLNSKLNLLMILTVTAVVGLGIGHFIGWSNQWDQQKQLSMGQVLKLKQLQDDLLVCMKHQDATEDHSHVRDQHKVCHRDSDYWKQRFETLFSENQGLIELFQKTQKHFREHGDHANVIGEHECVNKTTSEEFHKLKLDLLVNQMEHLKLLEVLEEVKNKEKRNQQRVKVLQEENLDLKKKLEEEEEDDQALEQTWGSRVAKLQNENEALRQTLVDDDVEDAKLLNELRAQIDSVSRENGELKSIIEQLEKQMSGGGVAAESWSKHDDDGSDEPKWSRGQAEDTAASYVARYNALRDRINQMMSENEELKAKIARYRWTSSSSGDHDQRREKDQRHHYKKNDDDDDDEGERKMRQMKAKLHVLHQKLVGEQLESRRWREKFESIMKKMKKMEERQQRAERRNRRGYDTDHQDSDGQDGEEEEEEKTGKDHHQKDPRKRKWDAFRAKWNAKLESISAKSKKFLNNFYDKLKGKWNKLHKRYSKEFANTGAPLNGDKLVQIGQFLESALENVHNFSEKLFHSGMRSDVVSYFTDKMTDFASLLEKNLNLKPRWSGKEQEEPDRSKYYAEEETSESYESWEQNEEEEEATRNEQKGDSAPPPPYPSMSKKSWKAKRGGGSKSEPDWLAERAKAREKYRRMRYQSDFVN